MLHYSFSLHFHLYVCVHTPMRVFVWVCICYGILVEVRGFEESALFPPCGSWASNQVVRLGCKYLYRLCHLAGSQIFLHGSGVLSPYYRVCDGQPGQGPVLETAVLHSSTGWPQMHNSFSASAFQVLECVYEPLCLVHLKF